MANDVRHNALETLQKIIVKHQSLTPSCFVENSPALQQLVYGVMRYWHQLDGLISLLVDKPLKAKDNDIQIILLMGCYELLYSHTEEYAIISESVNLVTKIDKLWAKGLVNAILRRLQREKKELLEQLNEIEITQFSHPQWLIEELKAAYPDKWQTILTINNTQAPMTLRVNPNLVTREQYIKILTQQDIQATLTTLSPDGITLRNPQPMAKLPGFEKGWVTVQDEAAQYAAMLLDCQPGMSILDACAAPGNKTAHIAIRYPDCQLLAIDKDFERVQNIKDLQQRLNFKADIQCADATRPNTWWNGYAFDRILIDAPCSATGVIRRHPDIKYHRRQSDIAELVKQQQMLLTTLWPLLQVNGQLLYVTCSLLPQENSQQVEWFLQQQPNAKLLETKQLFPTENGHDGLFFAKFMKG